MERDQQFVDVLLDRAVAEYETNPLSPQLMRRVARQWGDLFSVAAIRHLESGEKSGGHRYLSVLLLQQASLLSRIADPATTTPERTRRLLQNLLALDPSFDIKLAGLLPSPSAGGHAERFTGSTSTRLLHILDEASRGRRLLGVVRRLARSTDATTRAAATLFFGKRVKSLVWAEKQLEQEDADVRASAVESLWGIDSPPARQLLERCVNDSSNAVAGNALAGLHILNSPETLTRIDAMANAAKPEVRAAAAWAMGRILDPALAPALTILVRDEDAGVRSTALRALLNIRKEEAERPVSEALPPAEAALPETPAPAVSLPETNEEEMQLPGFALGLDGSRFFARRRGEDDDA